ncbi:GNAT family N-acetyltransferase [Legionella israelensis]|uniref:Methylamine utilization protein MauE n=1 Tax=Legionella israelensis TaxID=454 RepID=A0A0W0VSC0_9GAMM|nr:GNAT family N-acetyltransferase [Legionella israelensis]KTD22917.1 glutaredoxin [Legionella israelensis]QBS08810.1 N-acetyltransferase [Legionella israelensis]SCY57886.1 Predicted acetyltransferase, GNAT superfamily [Legionella israelensis DSM 19235]STX58490.1 glutaredoxin [Legionella israelensis]
MDLNLQHDKKNKRFYVEIDNKESELKYKKVDEKTLDYFTTFVPADQRGQGIAAKITDFALRYAKKNNYKVLPTCPFVKNYIDNHPEYKDLVVKESDSEEEDNKSLKKYWPLVSLILVSILAGLALLWQTGGGMRAWMHYYMGVFLVIFSTLKVFHPLDFADGFEMYDIIAKRSRVYAYCYPLIELFLGLAFLSFFLPILTYIVTIIIFTIGSVGVIQALQEGLDIKCPCMGTVLDVPLSTVTLTEDISMAVMAFILLVINII